MNYKTQSKAVRSLLEGDSYSYASSDVKVPPELADFLLDWSKLNIPDDALFTDEDGGKGRERDLHVTVKYGLRVDEVTPELRSIAKGTTPFKVILGSVSLFTNPEFDVVKLDVESPELHALNKQISDAIDCKETFPTYHPHCTLAYVKKGSCAKLVGNDPLKEKDVARAFTASGMSFSGPGEDDDDDRANEMILFSQVKATESMVARVLGIVEHAVTVTDSDRDPFGKCNFPADPDQVRQFLRRNARKPFRTVL